MDRFEWIATAAFGLEGVVARELAQLGLDAKAENGGARFFGSFEDAFRANLHARCADRILLVMGRFEARSFEALFEGVRALPWEDFIGEHTRFPVNGKCARSQLMSVRDCQAITKKAIVERLRGRYRTDWFVEDAETVSIDVALHGDVAQLTLDASGTALKRRGYRTWNGEAPLRETLAAALGEEAVTLEDLCEPYLMQMGFLTRTPRGRCATRLAYEHLGLKAPETGSPEDNGQQSLF